MNQPTLFPELGASQSAPKLDWYDLIVINTSGGKDSQAMVDHVYQLADQAGVLDRLLVVHADLGRIEWPGTRELAAEQAAAYGLQLDVVAKKDTAAAPADLLDRVLVRGMWPSASARWCTSDHKRGAIRPYFTRAAKTWRSETGIKERPCRILSTMGMRSQESPARAKRSHFVEGVINTKNQRVDEWLPIHEWTETDVWERIKQTGIRHHWAYDKGMSRLSCSFCVLANRKDLVLAAQLRPELAAEYVAVERATGHTFQSGTTIAGIVKQAQRSR